MVEVLLAALVVRQVREVFVIMVLLEQQNAFLGKRRNNAVGDGRLARPGAAADADDQVLLRHCSPA